MHIIERILPEIFSVYISPCVLLSWKPKSTSQKILVIARIERKKRKKGIFSMDLMESCQLPARFAYSVLFACWSLLWSVSVPGAICFNVDVEHPLIFTGPQGSYFGAATELVVDKSKW